MKQALLRTVMPDGVVFQLVVLTDDRCAILRDRDFDHVAPGGEAGIDDAVRRFTSLTRPTDDQTGNGAELTPRRDGAGDLRHL